MFRALFQMITPLYCVKCNSQGEVLCTQCVQDGLNPAHSSCYRCNTLTDSFKTCRSCRSSSPIYSLYKVGLYETPLKELVQAAKFSCSRDAAERIGDLIAKDLMGTHNSLITSVPTDPLRVRRRGYDHANTIAKSVAARLNLPYHPSMDRLNRVRQVGASREDRQRQASGLFRIKRSFSATAKSVIIVDDVVSTGATIEAAAKTLKSAGVKRVCVAVLAHNR